MATSYTENGATAHASTNSSLIDLFVKSVRNCSVDTIMKLCPMCWNENPTAFMSLIYLTRDPRNGKGERDVSYAMLKWLKEKCPRTYAKNILRICETYGRFDDLLKMANIGSGVLEYELFANALKKDLGTDKPSLAAKWAPRECNNPKEAKILSKILFPNDKKCSMRYRKEIIAPLAKKLEIIETKMCQNDWESIQYSHVPAQAMKLYGRNKVRVPNPKTCETDNSDSDEDTYNPYVRKFREGAFIRHDNTRFTQYLEDVKNNKTKINVKGMEPHKLVEHYLSSPVVDPMIECQWQTIIDNLKRSGSLQSSMAIVDVSGSMGGEPMNVAIALGLIVAQMSQAPFNNKIITFESEPHIISLTGKSLMEKVMQSKSAPWGGMTNLIGVFKLILETATTFNVPNENMIKTLYVFTDMQFDSAIGNIPTSQSYNIYARSRNAPTEKTIYETIRQMHNERGYTMPNIVFWNLRDISADAFPVTVSEEGTAMVSGFSAELLKVFMSGIPFEPSQIFIQLIDKYISVVEIDENEECIKF